MPAMIWLPAIPAVLVEPPPMESPASASVGIAPMHKATSAIFSLRIRIGLLQSFVEWLWKKPTSMCRGRVARSTP